MYRDLFRGWDFPPLEVDFPLPRISKVYMEKSTKVLEHV